MKGPSHWLFLTKKWKEMALKDTPVDRMLSKKHAGIEGTTKALEHAKVQKDNFEREFLEQRFIIPVLFLSVGNVTSRWDTPEETVMEMNVHPPCCAESLTSILMTKLYGEICHSK